MSSAKALNPRMNEEDAYEVFSHFEKNKRTSELSAFFLSSPVDREDDADDWEEIIPDKAGIEEVETREEKLTEESPLDDENIPEVIIPRSWQVKNKSTEMEQPDSARAYGAASSGHGNRPSGDERSKAKNGKTERWDLAGVILAGAVAAWGVYKGRQAKEWS
ncbi:hypothetical protein BDV10DRAFT_183064 [Aspergillus recurvatus]